MLFNFIKHFCTRKENATLYKKLAFRLLNNIKHEEVNLQILFFRSFAQYMTTPNKKLTLTEQEIMNYIWEQNTEICKQDLVKRFSPEKSPTSLSFYLSKLTEKGFLAYQKRGRNFFYTTIISKEVYRKENLYHQAEEKLNLPLESFLARFCGKEDASQKDLEIIRETLEKLSQKLRCEEDE